MYKGEQLEALPINSWARQGCSPSPGLSAIAPEIWATLISQEIGGVISERKRQKYCSCVGYDYTLEKPKKVK